MSQNSLLPLMAVLILASCRPQLNYRYLTSMQPSTNKDSLIYDNDSLNIRFEIRPKLIWFKYHNKLDKGVRISWDEVSMSIDGNSFRVLHKETGVYKTREIQPTTSIPPRSFLTDGLIPSEKVNYGYSSVTGNNQVTVDDIFPNKDWGSKKIKKKILGLKGKSIMVYLPVYINNNFSSLAFQINIDDVKSYTDKEYKALKSKK
jgi:hypothetical protein